MPFGATPSRWCVCQFHHFRRLQTALLSIACNYNFKLPQFSVYAFLYALFATYRSRSSSTAACESSDPLRRLHWLLFLIDPPERPADRLRPRVDITHRGLDGVVPGDVLQRKGVRVLSRLGQKRVAQSVKSGIRIELNLITGKLFPETPHFRFEHPGLEFLVGVQQVDRHTCQP